MSAQAALAAKTAITTITIAGTAFSLTPRGKDNKNVLQWVNAGATSLDDVVVDFSYRLPTSTRKSTKATLRTFVPKTFTDSTTGLVAKAGDNIANLELTFPENATATEKQKLLDIFTAAVAATEFRAAITNGDVMY